MLEAGRHTIKLVFSGETFEVAFTLLKPTLQSSLPGNTTDAINDPSGEGILANAGDTLLAINPTQQSSRLPLILMIVIPLMLLPTAIYFALKIKSKKLV